MAIKLLLNNKESKLNKTREQYILTTFVKKFIWRAIFLSIAIVTYLILTSSLIENQAEKKISTEIYDQLKTYVKNKSEYKDNIVSREQALVKTIDNELSEKLSGAILLQVESDGEAWYVFPADKKKYYLGDPESAFKVMRKLGLGVAHELIVSNSKFPDNVLGRIILDVEQNGEAYYINPESKIANFLGRPDDAYRVIKELGIGISNEDIRKIEVGELD